MNLEELEYIKGHANVQVESTTPPPGGPTAEAILSRSEAVAHDVHAYALGEIAAIEMLIVQLKSNIERKKLAREEATRAYIEAVDAAVRATRPLEDTLAKLSEAIDQT